MSQPIAMGGIINLRRLGGFVAFAATGFIVVGGPALAGTELEEQPDLHIGVPGFDPVGEDVYYVPTGPQSWTHVGLDVGEKQKFVVTVENDGDVASKYRLRVGSGNEDFAVKYATSGTNITKAVTRGFYTTPKLDPATSTTLKLKVTSNNDEGSGDLFRAHVLATAAKDPGDNDMVLAFVNNN